MERAVPGKASAFTMAHHLARYRLAQQHCCGKVVLDAGCGVGYGSVELAQTARLVVGLDLCLEAVQQAARQHWRDNLIFVAGQCEHLPFAANTFDVVCLFEVVEHVPDDERLMAEVHSVMKPGGVLLASTPNRLGSTKPECNPFHVRAYSAEEFEEFLGRWFAGVVILHQVPRALNLRSLARRVDILGLRRGLSKVPGIGRLKEALFPRPHAIRFVKPDGRGVEPDYITAVCHK